MLVTFPSLPWGSVSSPAVESSDGVVGDSVKESVTMTRFRRENTEECHFFVDAGNLELARFLSVKRRVSMTVTLNNALQFYLDNHPDTEFLKKLK